MRSPASRAAPESQRSLSREVVDAAQRQYSERRPEPRPARPAASRRLMSNQQMPSRAGKRASSRSRTCRSASPVSVGSRHGRDLDHRAQSAPATGWRPRIPRDAQPQSRPAARSAESHAGRGRTAAYRERARRQPAAAVSAGLPSAARRRGSRSPHKTTACSIIAVSMPRRTGCVKQHAAVGPSDFHGHAGEPALGFGDGQPSRLADRLTHRKGLLSARGVLFPELGAEPLGRLVEGILRAPRRGWRPPPILSACAPECSRLLRAAGRASLPPGRLLGETGWESPELLARAAAARQALVAARVGGTWWEAGAEPEMPEGGILAWSRSPNPRWPIPPPTDEQTPRRRRRCSARRYQPTRPSRSSCLPRRGPPGGCAPRWQTARARGVTVIERACDPWSLLDRADRVYSVGGEIGFLALLAGVPVTAFAAAYYTGLGRHRRQRRCCRARLPAPVRRDFRRHLPHRDAVPRSVPRCRDRIRGGPGDCRRVAPDRDA